jgi:hypothetical protein
MLFFSSCLFLLFLCMSIRLCGYLFPPALYCIHRGISIDHSINESDRNPKPVSLSPIFNAIRESRREIVHFIRGMYKYNKQAPIYPISHVEVNYRLFRSPMPLKRLKYRDTLLHISLGRIILRNQFRHQLEDLIEKVPGNNDDAFEGVDEDDVSLRKSKYLSLPISWSAGYKHSQVRR